MNRRLVTGALVLAVIVAILWAMHSVDAIAFLKHLHGR